MSFEKKEAKVQEKLLCKQHLSPSTVRGREAKQGTFMEMKPSMMEWSDLEV